MENKEATILMQEGLDNSDERNAPAVQNDHYKQQRASNAGKAKKRTNTEDLHTYRRFVEKRRKHRINRSMDDLKNLLPSSMRQEKGNRQKRGLLEMTVDHMRSMTNNTEAERSENCENESPVDVTDGPVPLPPLEHSDVIRAGFQDCLAETVRYLVDVESIPEDDPIVDGLREFISKRQDRLDYEDILENSDNRSEDEKTHTFLTNNQVIHEEQNAENGEDEVDGLIPPISEIAAETLGQLSRREPDSMADFETVIPHLSILGRNNPAIAKVTEEIACLLENGDDN
ncbi:uncharacterized protein LOC141907463 [Tubulanus polymorphus]|uniref:uncharacterized protein LOC141907463 n=1 Tax=Tubulanus polymorphus TaxID=672921 RepID=UPI003DA3F481